MSNAKAKKFALSLGMIMWGILSAGFWLAGELKPAMADAEIQKPRHASSESLSAAEIKWGIKILGLHQTSAGHMLDLRFKVLDPVKSRPVLSKGHKAYLLDEASGKALPVPITKSGSLRQTTEKPEEGRIYFILFSNPNKIVKEGGRTTLIIGDFKMSGIPVASSAPVGSKEAAGSSMNVGKLSSPPRNLTDQEKPLSHPGEIFVPPSVQ